MSSASSDRVYLLFNQAKDLPADEQLAFLDRKCAKDPLLRQQVEALLGADRAMEASTATGQDNQDFFLDEHKRADDPKQIGNYKLLQLVGEGGMGEVWMAEQESPVRRRVALKLIKFGMDSKQIVARFEAERQALAMMDHQNIAKVLDAGTTDSGRPYFVMELVQGITFTDYCDKNKLSLNERLGLFISVCKAVQHAHQKGIIHRDLKPSNVLVTLHDGQPVPKVIDFGLAKALQHQTRLTDKTLFTEFNQVVGTVQYMSPEQAEMNSLDVDTRTDIYSLGVMFYELLTGSTPIDRESAGKEAIWNLLEWIRERDPPRPSTRLGDSGDAITGILAQRQIDPGKLQKILRADLDWIAMKALEKDRSRRYNTADGFADDIERYLAGEPIEARQPSLRYQIRKALRKHRTAVLTAASVMLLLMGGIATTTSQWIRAEKAAARALLAETTTKEEAERYKKVVDTFVSSFRSPDPNNRDVDIQMSAKDVLIRASRRITDRLDEDPLTQAKMLFAIAQSFLALGEYEAALSNAEKVHQIYSTVLGLEHPDTLSSMGCLATAHLAIGNVVDGLPLLEQTAFMFSEKIYPINVQLVVNLALGYTLADRLEDARKIVEETLNLVRSKLGPEHPDTLQLIGELATLHAKANRLADALPLFDKAVNWHRNKYGFDHPDTLRLIGNLAITYAKAERLTDAIPLFEEFSKHADRKLGARHPLTVKGKNNLAEAYVRTGRPSDAVPLLEDRIAREIELDSPDYSATLTIVHKLAWAFVKAGRAEDSITLYERMLATVRDKLGADHADVLKYTNALAVAYRVSGQLDAALPLFEWTLEQRRRYLPTDHPDTRDSMRWLHVIRLQLEHYELAEKVIREWLDTLDRVGDSSESEKAWALTSLAAALSGQGKNDEASENVVFALRIQEIDPVDEARAYSVSATCLARDGEFSLAEKALVRSLKSLIEQLPNLPHHLRWQVPRAIDRMIELYELWGKPEEVEKWTELRSRIESELPNEFEQREANSAHSSETPASSQDNK